MNTSNAAIIFNFHNITSLTVYGEGKLVDYLCYQYREFIAEKDHPSANISLTIKKDCLSAPKSKSYHEGQFNFSVADSYFCWQLYGKNVIFSGTDSLSSITEIDCDAEFNRIQLNMIIELFLRIQFSKAGFSLVHAACFAKQGQAILVPAAKSTGKTALCLNALEQGFEFMSDDRLWLNANGDVYAFPRYIVITKSNAKYFDQWQGTKNKRNTWLRNIANKLTPTKRLKKIVSKILNRLIPFKVIYYKLIELYPESNYQMQGNIAGSAMLFRDDNSDNKLQATDANVVEDFIAQVANLEWNYELLTAASIHDMLFINKPQWHDEVQALIDTERAIVKKALSNTHNCYLGLNSSSSTPNWKDIISQLNNHILK